MDRRQRKTREAIFSAFTQLLSEKDLTQITVGDIIRQADVGRATFYAHFETKDYLLKALCEELFCHIFDAAQEKILELWGEKVEVYRAAPRIIDIHAKGVSKAKSARQLQQQLGKKILVCAGDAENDLSMMRDADYAFAPADGIIADRFETVCPCAEGAVADVIYKKIPEILDLNP